MSNSHWLQAAVTSIAGANTSSLDISEQTAIADKWQAVARQAGVSEAQLADAAASHLGLTRADMNMLEPDFARQIPESTARMQDAIPVVMKSNHVLVAMLDPADAKTLESLAFTLRATIEPCIATPAEMEQAYSQVYGQDGGDLDAWGSVPTSLLAQELVLKRKDGSLIDSASSATSKLFVELIRRAFHVNASDIHIQPYGEGAVVRNRVDGILYRTLELPSQVHLHLVRHVKAVSGMDPTKHMVPQDGELHMEIEHREVDLRLSVLPVGSTERLVVRLLPQNQVRSLGALKLAPEQQSRLERLSENADGMVLMTGPTGSGKTSLLYAMLAKKNTPDINIMTVEEPVEYHLRGASQIDVDAKAGLTFAKSLRSILRQDPDVVMIGEIRDEETAGIAAQAAMTGHFVLSTVHTLDALLATVRMRDLGVSSATLADALHAVVSQRLVRQLCTHCCKPLSATELSVDEQKFAAIAVSPPMKKVGCEQCHSTGYAGRLPVVEVVEITGDLKKALRAGGQDIDEMELLAAEAGTQFLAQGFAARIEEGTTTVEEVLRVYGRSFFQRLEHFNNLTKLRN